MAIAKTSTPKASRKIHQLAPASDSSRDAWFRLAGWFATRAGLAWEQELKSAATRRPSLLIRQRARASALSPATDH